MTQMTEYLLLMGKMCELCEVRGNMRNIKYNVYVMPNETLRCARELFDYGERKKNKKMVLLFTEMAKFRVLNY